MKIFLLYWSLLWILFFTKSINGDDLETIVEEKESGQELNNQTATHVWYQRNRDDSLPKFPIVPDLRLLSTYIVNAHEVLRQGLKQFLIFKETDLGTYLNFLVNKRTEPFVDEYGQVIRAYKKVLRFIWEQHNETVVQNYAINQFDKDKLHLCSVARFLSHQTSIKDRETIMKRMSDALKYRCHPCTPYTPKQYDETAVPSTSDINAEEISPEESLQLCKESVVKNEESVCSTSDWVLNVTPDSFDYSPCRVYLGGVTCDGIPIEEVQHIFSRTIIPILHSFKLGIRSDTKRIPENLLNNKRVMEIDISGPGIFGSIPEPSYSFDANAFQSTKNFTKILKVSHINCSCADLNFLKGFNQLTNLTLKKLTDIHLCAKTLPGFPRLTTLNLHTGDSTLNFFPLLTNGLKIVVFLGDEIFPHTALHDENIDQTMDWLLLSSSNTLEELTIQQMKRLTRVPRQISSFKALRKLWMNKNGFSIIKPGALSFSAPVSSLNIFCNGINEIKPGAFQGNFKDAEVLISSDYYCGYGSEFYSTSFEESVYGTMLQQMASGTGFIYANTTKIDCGKERICHLAWLMPYQTVLLEERFVNFVRCSNGTAIRQLHQEGFNHC